MRLVLCLVIASVASACVSTAADSPSPVPDYLLAPQYRALPSVAASETVAEAQPAVPTGDRQLDAFLAELAAALDRHDWRGVVARFEPESYAEQWALVQEGRSGGGEVSAVQVLAETLGLQGLLRPYETLAQDPMSRLDRLQVVTLREVEREASGTVRVRGDVRLEDDTRLPLDFLVQLMGDTFVVLVPMG